MRPQQGDEFERRKRGERAEDVALAYFRFNGFFTIPGFIIHPGEPGNSPRTDIDLIAIRFALSCEAHGCVELEDDPLIVPNETSNCHLIYLVEVKSGNARINGPHTDPSKRNIHRALYRVGFAPKEDLDQVADCIYKSLYAEYSNDDGQTATHVVRYVTVSSDKGDLAQTHPRILQVTFDDIAKFFSGRFRRYPTKRFHDDSSLQWKGFAQKFHDFAYRGGSKSDDLAIEFVKRYIQDGPERCKCEMGQENR